MMIRLCNLKLHRSKQLAGLALIVILISGCAKAGPLQTWSESVELAEAKSARVELRLGAGEFKVSDGAEDLLDATFVTNVAEWEPQLTYEVSDQQGRLRIQQPRREIEDINLWSLIRSADNLEHVRNSWDLQLNRHVPIDLDIAMGAGTSELKLGGLTLTHLEIAMGAGEMEVDLTGDWQHDLEALIQGGVGEITVRLPSNVGVRVEAQQGGIGEINAQGLKREGRAYVNDAYGQSDVTLRLRVNGGIGEINLISSG
jgi:hypothetical protein